MVLKVIVCILIGFGVFFSLPSTIFTCMFLGVFRRRKSRLIEKDDLRKTHYCPYADILKNDILKAKEIPCEVVKIKSKDGVCLHSRYYNGNSDRAIIFLHGYQSNAFNNFSTIMLDYLKKGYSVLLVDQRAHGDSGGKYTTAGHREKEDLMLWIDYITAKAHIRNVFIYGISMGATTLGYASETIKSKKVKGLIMEAGFISIYDEIVSGLGRVFMKKWALNYLCLMSKTFLKIDIRKSTELSLRGNELPVLFMHGNNDKDVTIEFTKRNYTACASKKEFIEVEGAGHTLCYVLGGDFVRNAVDNFIEKCINE